MTKEMFYAAIIVLLAGETMRHDSAKMAIPVVGKMPTMFHDSGSPGLFGGLLGGMAAKPAGV
jgi:hypothetical protein